MPTPQPLFLTFEGLDGSGKSTHLRRAAAWLAERGLDCVATHEPGGTPLGNALRSVFLDRQWGPLDGRVELMVVFASRRQHLLQRIDPALQAGQHVLCDRFTDSTFAYQGRGRGVDWELIRQVDQLATESRRPDATLLFDLEPEEARLRGHSVSRQKAGEVDRLDVEQLDFYRRVRAGFLELAALEPERFRVIDASGDQGATWEQVEAVLREIFP